MAILKTILVILEVLLIFNLLIGVHELGHFLAAKWRGLQIDRFAIWFGKPIWKKRINGVEYVLGSIPAGGYVALPQMATMEAIEGKSESSDKPLPPISALDKIIVAFAGPLFSLLLAFAFAVMVWQVGKPEQEITENSTTIGWVEPNGPADKVGLRAGDRILEIDDQPVTQFLSPTQDSVIWRIMTSEGDSIAIKYERNGEVAVAQAVPYRARTKWYERKAMRQIRVERAYPAIIHGVATNGPAQLAGLQAGDEVIAVNGEKIYSPGAMIAAQESLTNHPTQPLTLTVRRGEEQFDRTLLAREPVQPSGAPPSLGITGWTVNANEILVHPRPVEQVRESAGMIFATLRTVFSSKSDVGLQQLGGPVMILRAYKNFLESENGWRRVLWFSVVLNVNLALLNMLPFPVLDGGHITLALVEAMRRRPVSGRLLNYLQTFCAMLLIGFMLFIAFFDTGDWVRSARQSKPDPIIFAPPGN